MNKTALSLRSNSLLGSLVLLMLAPVISVQALAATDIAWNGDLRYRFMQVKESADETRLLQQLRARLGLRANVQDDLDAVLKFATATSAISNNQVMGDSTSPGMVRRTFGIDLAYGEWRFADDARLVLGRGPNPFFSPGRTQFLFDQDLAFEGISTSYARTWSDSSAFVNFGAFIISENYSAPRDSVDTGLVGMDIGYSFKAIGQWTLHAARFHYLNVADQAITRFDSSARIDSYSSPFERYRGNTVYATNPSAPLASRTYNMATGFTLNEIGAEWKHKTESCEITSYIDWAMNELASTSGDAWEVGVQTKVGRLQALVAYAIKKSDSMIAAFTDSDFNGGGTDYRGSKISLSYQLGERSNVVLTDYRGTRGIDSTSRDYNAQQLDFSLQF